MLIVPTATAAADAVSVMVGSTQNDVNQNIEKNPARHSQVNTAAHGCPGVTASSRNAAAPSCPATQCVRRFPVRSDDQPETTTATSPQR